MRQLYFQVCFVALLLLSARVSADEIPFESYNFILPSVVLVAVGGAMAGVYFGVGKSPECKWCGSNSFDMVIQEALGWFNKKAASMAGNVLFYGGVPAFGVASAVGLNWEKNWRYKLYDSLLILDATVVSMLASTLTTQLSARERPWYFYNMTEYKGDEADAHMSFPSGHVLVTFAATIASAVMAFEKSKCQGCAVLASGASFSLLMGYLRIAAAKHWASDVLVGLGVAPLFGVLVPLRLRTFNGILIN